MWPFKRKRTNYPLGAYKMLVPMHLPKYWVPALQAELFKIAVRLPEKTVREVAELYYEHRRHNLLDQIHKLRIKKDHSKLNSARMRLAAIRLVFDQFKKVMVETDVNG